MFGNTSGRKALYVFEERYLEFTTLMVLYINIRHLVVFTFLMSGNYLKLQIYLVPSRPLNIVNVENIVN